MSDPVPLLVATDSVPLPVVYKFDENRRVYARDANGRSSGGPIYREHFRPLYVVGEVKRSWLVSSFPDGMYHYKVGKDNVYTAEQVDEKCWMNDHKYRVSRAVERCNDVALLKAVAALVGYVPEDGK